MIGQEGLISSLNSFLKNNTFPRFSIITGSSGSGKKTLIETVFKSVKDILFVTYGISVDDVRKAIADSHNLSGVKEVIFFPDADMMSVQAKNAMLKLSEEPPENCYVIMSLNDITNTLDTIKSRAVVFQMQPYTSGQLKAYAKKYNLTDEEKDRIVQLCETPGEMDILINAGLQEFYEYVELVADNIGEVSDANCFKIASRVALKPDAEGYDLKLFLKAFIAVCMSRFEEDMAKYAVGVSITGKYLQELGIKGISKQMLIDSWIMSIRKVWCV